MPIFFRNLRAGLPKNTVIKYVLYAVGEIIVVVVGILIAIQLDNANEQNKRSKDIKALFATIEDNLKSDIPYLEEELIYNDQKDSLIQMVLENKVTKEMYSTNPDFLYLLTTATNTAVNVVGVQAVLSRLNDISDEQRKLIEPLNNLIINANTLKDTQARALSYMLQVNNEWSDRYEWFKDLTKGTEAQIVYFHSNPIYKNKLYYYSILLKHNYHPAVKLYRESAIDLLLEIWYSERKSNKSILLELKYLISELETIELIQKSEITKVQSRLKKESNCDLIINNQSSQPVIVKQFYQDSDETYVATVLPGRIFLINDSNLYCYALESPNSSVIGYLQGVTNSVFTLQ